MKSRIWFIAAATVGALAGFFGLFGDGGWRGAALGAVVGLVAVAWQNWEDKRKWLPARTKPSPVRPASTPGAATSLPTRSVLWRRCKTAKHAQLTFVAAGIAAFFFPIGLVLARPDQTVEMAIYGLVVLVLFTVGIYKWHAARQEVARLLDIVQRGVAAEAQVESVQVSQVSGGATFPLELGWVASYSFLDRRGDRHYGESGYLTRYVAQRYRSGDRVQVIFDPDDPEMSVWAEASSGGAKPSDVKGGSDPPISRRAVLAGWAVLGVLGAIALAAVLLFPSSVELRPVVGLKDVKLGDSWGDVLDRRGPFDPDPPLEPGSDPARSENFRQRNGALQVWVGDKRVKGVSYYCQPQDSTRVNQIACGAPAARLAEAFGTSLRILCAKVADDDPRKADATFARAYDVIATGTRHVVERGHVTGFIIMEPSVLGARVGGETPWHPCGS